MLLQVGGVCIPGDKVEMESILTLLLEFRQLVNEGVARYDQQIELVFLLREVDLRVVWSLRTTPPCPSIRHWS